MYYVPLYMTGGSYNEKSDLSYKGGNDSDF